MKMRAGLLADESRRLLRDEALNHVLDSIRDEALQELTAVDASDTVSVLRLQERAKMPEELRRQFESIIELDEIEGSA